MTTYWYYNKDGKLYSSNEAKLWLAKDNCMHFGNLPQHVKDLNGLLPLTVKHEWVDLTDEQIADYLGDEYHAMTESELRFFRLGEAAAKEKNT